MLNNFLYNLLLEVKGKRKNIYDLFTMFLSGKKIFIVGKLAGAASVLHTDIGEG